MKGKNLWIALKKNVRNGLDWICIEVVYKKCLAMSPSLHPNVAFITPFSYAILYHVEEGQESISKRWCLLGVEIKQHLCVLELF